VFRGLMITRRCRLWERSSKAWTLTYRLTTRTLTWTIFKSSRTRWSLSPNAKQRRRMSSLSANAPMKTIHFTAAVRS